MQAAPPSFPTPRLIFTLLFLGLPAPLPPAPLYATAATTRKRERGRRRRGGERWLLRKFLQLGSRGGFSSSALPPLHFCWGRMLRSQDSLFSQPPFPSLTSFPSGPVSRDQSHHFHSDPCCCCSLIPLLIAHSSCCLLFAPLLPFRS